MAVAQSSEVVISFSGVRKTFGRAVASATAVDGLSLEVRRGEYVCIVGRTGCGKSTTVNLLLGLLEASDGAVRVLGHDPYRQFAQLKGRLACIFQGDRLLPWRRAVDNVRLPLEILRIDESALPLGARDWLGKVGLENSAEAFPHELSGGMRQRVAIARALISDPEIVIADEAFGHLDEVTGARIKADFKHLVRAGRKTVLHITHSIDEAIEFADRVIVLGKPGRVVAAFELNWPAATPDRERLRAQIYEQIELSDRQAPASANAAPAWSDAGALPVAPPRLA